MNIDFSWEKERIVDAVRSASEEVMAAAKEQSRPSVLFKPKLSLDGNAWIALLGDNLQEGVVGTGRSPEEAMRDFDISWTTRQPAMVPTP